MVGSDKAKEALAMMALHEALRNVCVNSDWTYSVFWTIRPRPRSRGGAGCKVGEDNGSLMLMWEDGYCRSSKPRVNRLPGMSFNGNGMDKMVKSSSFDCLEELDADDPVRKAFRKMSIQLYNYGEGLMGKVASDKCHKWVFKEPTECETGISNYWQSSFDAHPPEWTDQFNSGIQTIAVIQAGHGLLQLGSCKIIPEDLHFVLRMRHTFESLGYQSGFYLSQLFTGGRNPNPNGGSSTNKPTISLRPPLFNWSQRPLSTFPNPRQQQGLPFNKDEPHFLLNNNNSADSLVSHMESEPIDLVKWPNGLSYFNALTARGDDKHLFFGLESLSLPQSQPFLVRSTQPPSSTSSSSSSLSPMDISIVVSTSKNNNEDLHFEGGAVSDYLSPEGGDHDNFNVVRKMHAIPRLDRFKRSLTLPARMPEHNHHDHSQTHEQHPQPCNSMDYATTTHVNRHHAEVGSIYSDVMENFLE